MKRFAVYTASDDVLVGIEEDGFNVLTLAEKYGAGTFRIGLFENGKQTAEYRQTVSEKCVPKKNLPALPEGTKF